MVLGLRSKNRKGSSVEVEYLVHIQEIKPWPPSKSLKSVEAVYLKWESSDQTTGFLTSSVGAGKIEFNNFFRLPLSLRRDGKSKTRESFQKNCLEFYLYESQKDKAVKGQLLGSAIINISEYGIVKETISIYTPLNCKKSFRSTVQPVLFVKLQAFDKDSSTSSQTSLSKETSLDKDGSQSASELISEVNDDELEIASITDDDDDYDIRSHSSRTTSSAFKATEGLPSPKEENGSESGKDCNVQPTLHMIAASKKPHRNTGAEGVEHLNGNLSPLPSMELSSDSGNPADNQTSFSKFPERIIPTPEESATYSVKSSSSFLGYLDNNKESDVSTRGFPQNSMAHNFREKVAGESSSRTQEHVSDSLAAKVASTNTYSQVGVDSKHVSSAYSKGSKMDDIKARRRSEPDKEIITTDVLVSLPGKKQQVIGHEEHILKEKKLSSEKDLLIQIPQDTIEKQVTLRSSTLPYGMRALGVQGRNETSNKLQHMKSVPLHSESANYKGIVATNKIMDKTKVVNTQEDAHNTSTSYATSERKETAHGFDNSKSELESRVKMLEEELREAAAIEVGLYSVVAEHGSSVNKVHAPARRLSRYYLHACKSGFEAKQASAARAAVSGLVLVSKACGNDVPRLTFWLSNSIVLREIVSKAVGELPISSGSRIKFNGGGEETQRRFSLKRNQLSSNEEEKNNSVGGSDDWEDPQTFIVALENIEAWIFSRIVESVWWQTLTPYMQSAAAKGSTSRKNSVRRYGLGDQDQVNFSIELWKKAFKDACERLCPIRAGGHECGCLHVLARLVMEQLVNRLDVAMFNAILRESEEEMPTDPMSDPISDSRVLPIPAGKSSFGAGAQLKNAIGNWSRWLTDLFGIDDNDPHEDENNLAGDKRPESEASFKAFHVLNALSDLMMLPWEMLADSSTRKEVCPKFGTPVIKTVLSNFVPDEFCPDPIPESVFEALDSEDSTEAVGESISISSIPVNATPPVYLPPAASVASVIGEFGRQSSTGGSSILKKSYTSDDELDELDSPITSIISENFPVSASSTGPDWMRKAKWGRNVVRYKLLREIWTMEEQ